MPQNALGLRTVQGVVMAMINPRQAAVATSAAVAGGVVLPTLRNVIREVMAERADNLAFRQAISDHERENTQNPAVTQSLAQQASSGRSGGVRSGGSSSMVPTNRADLKVSPSNDFRVPKRIPTILPRVVWDTVKVRSTLTASNGGISEANFSVNLQTHPQYASWQAIYDQWCVPQFSLTFFSRCAPGSATAPIILHSALDFDNTTNLGSISTLDDYGTATVKILSAGQSYTRSVRPCTKPTLSANSSAGISRCWCDTGTPTVPWFGIRTILEQLPSGAQDLVVEITVWYAFRNAI